MIKGLIENECGGQNALVKLTNHLNSATNEQKLAPESIRNVANKQFDFAQHNSNLTAPISHLDPNNFVNEYLNEHKQRQLHAMPQTLNMESLFYDLKQIDSNAMSKSLSSNYAQDANTWSNEYWSAFQNQPAKPSIENRSFKWSADYLNESNIIDENFNLASALTVPNSNNQFLTMPSRDLLANGLNSNTNNSNMMATSQLNEDMKKTANELLDSMQDNRFSETEFLQFVRNLSINGMNVNNKSELKPEPEAIINTDDLASEWINEFQNFNTNTATRSNDASNYWNELQDEWNSAALSNSEHPWLDDFKKVFDNYRVYEFDKENPLASHPNPFEEGLERLKQHDIVNAVLLFEVAVQKEPNNMLAWQYLGTTQVENEQDTQAIKALRKCLDLKPDNLIAISTLATSYTNESMQRLAFDSLIKWLKYHPNYSELLRNDEHSLRLLAESDMLTAENGATPFYLASLGVVNARDFMDLQEVFLKAVRLSAPKIDPELQCNLGVLFHLSGEYDKAADCFKTALQVKPDDHLLWNKLGATFANNNRNEEAIEAYYQALKLCPGFVRARYNLGIGCMNLGAYNEAVEHFLTALVQQSQGNVSNTNKSSIQMSETIWTTLRLALSYLNRSDLYESCLNKNLDLLRKEFKI